LELCEKFFVGPPKVGAFYLHKNMLDEVKDILKLESVEW
jgi:hypothetical protein